MRYKNRIVLTNSKGISYTLRSFSDVSISESETDPLKTCSVSAGFIDNKNIIKHFSIGSTIEIYTRRSDQTKEKRLFIGVINTVPRVLDQNIKTYNFEATCLLGKTQTILVNEFFENERLSTIVNYLIDNYTNFFKSKSVSVPNNERVTMEFRDEFLYDCFNKIAEAVDGSYEAVDDKFIFRNRESNVNDKEIKRGMFHKGSADFSDDSENMVNFIRGYGDKELTPNFREDEFTGNGKSDTFTTKYQPSKSEVYIDDVLQTLGEKNLHGDGYEVYVDYNNSSFEFVDPPPSDKKIRIKYKYYQRIVVEESDQNSIEEFGMFGEVVELEHIKDRELLREQLRKRINRYKEPIKSGSISPFYDYWDIRDLIYINLPELGVEEHLVCTSKDTKISPGKIDYDLNFEEPPNLTSILKNHLERIRELEKVDDEIEYIDKFRSVIEKIELKEEMKYDITKKKDTFVIGVNNIGDPI